MCEPLGAYNEQNSSLRFDGAIVENGQSMDLIPARNSCVNMNIQCALLLFDVMASTHFVMIEQRACFGIM